MSIDSEDRRTQDPSTFDRSFQSGFEDQSFWIYSQQDFNPAYLGEPHPFSMVPHHHQEASMLSQYEATGSQRVSDHRWQCWMPKPLFLLSCKFAPSLSLSLPRLLSRTNTWAAGIRRTVPWSRSRLWVNASSINEMDDYTSKSNGDLRKEALILQARAREMMMEARAMEVELLSTRKQRKQAKNSESDDIIDSLFPPNVTVTPAVVADRIRSERWSSELVYMVVERMFERQMIAIGQSVSSDMESPIDGRAKDIWVNETEFSKLRKSISVLEKAAAVLDKEVGTMDTASARRWSGRVEKGIQARINELQRAQSEKLERQFASEINLVANSNRSVEEYVRRSLNMSASDKKVAGLAAAAINASQVFTAVSLAPMWVPSSFLPFIISSEKSTLGPEQVDQIKDKVLQGSRFFVTSSDSIPGAAIFRGNIRSQKGAVTTNASRNDTAIVFEEIQSQLKREGLSDLVQLFFLPDPEWRYERHGVQKEPKPVLLALSKAVSPNIALDDPIVKVRNTLAYGSSLFTTFVYAICSYGLNPKFFKALVHEGEARVLAKCIPVVLGVLSIQLLHEVAHYVVAKRRQIKIGRPIPLLSPGLGLYGCITQLKSFPANRAALLDFALSGPLAAIAASLGCIITGVSLTTRASQLALSNFPFIPVAVLKSSFLVGSIMSPLASKTMMLPSSQPIPIHPLFVIGYSGLMASALNLLPMFRLDGGRAFSAAMGSRETAIVSVSLLLLLLSQSLSIGSSIALFWALMVLLFQRREEIPARDDVTDVDNFRFGAWLFTQLLSAIILLPFPGHRGII
eukprot:scaffold5490_cov125-Cylindrotheca_fusiformis.AAC.2